MLCLLKASHCGLLAHICNELACSVPSDFMCRAVLVAASLSFFFFFFFFFFKALWTGQTLALYVNLLTGRIPPYTVGYRGYGTLWHFSHTQPVQVCLELNPPASTCPPLVKHAARASLYIMRYQPGAALCTLQACMFTAIAVGAVGAGATERSRLL